MTMRPSKPLTPPVLAAGQVLTLPRILWGLFFEPGILFLLQYERWGRGLRCMAGTAVICGLAVGMMHFPDLVHRAADWSNWFGRETGELRVGDGEIVWDRPAVLPHTTRHGGWRIDFVTRKTPFKPVLGNSPERQGIWIAPEQIYAWSQSGQSKIEVMPLLVDKKVWGVMDLNWFLPQGLAVSGDNLTGLVRGALIRGFPVFLLMSVLSLFLQTLFYTLLFAIVPVLLRSPMAVGGFRQTFAFYSFASIPPLVVAALYSGLQLPYLDFDRAFVFGFIAYLFLVIRGLRTAAEQDNDDR